MTVAVTVFALLELYKLGEAAWEQPDSFGEIAVRAPSAAPAELGRLRLAGSAGMLGAQSERPPGRDAAALLASRPDRRPNEESDGRPIAAPQARPTTRTRSPAPSRRCCSCRPIH